MQPIKEPKAQTDYEERALDCREAIVPKVQLVTEAAMQAGWSRDEIKAAFIEITGHWDANNRIA